MPKAAEMEAMTKAGTPGDAHKKLDQFAGTWKAKVTHWMEPGAPPSVSAGTMKNTWVLGKRFLRQDYTGEAFGGMSFEGSGYFGFNNVTGRYEGFWIDIMSTGMMSEAGTCDKSGKVWTMVGKMEFPAAGNVMSKRSVITVHDKNRHTLQMFFAGPDGKESKAMEIEYTR